MGGLPSPMSSPMTPGMKPSPTRTPRMAIKALPSPIRSPGMAMGTLPSPIRKPRMASGALPCGLDGDPLADIGHNEQFCGRSTPSDSVNPKNSSKRRLDINTFDDDEKEDDDG